MAEETNATINNTSLVEAINKEEIPKAFKGDSIKFSVLKNKKFVVIACRKVRSTKDDCDYYYVFQIVIKAKKDGKIVNVAYITHTGSHDIKAFFDKVCKNEIKLPLSVKLCEDGRHLYFEGYRTYNEDVAKELIEKYDITLNDEDMDILDDES